MSFDLRQWNWWKLGIGTLGVAVLIGLALWFGPHLREEVVAFERWVTAQGVWGPIVFTAVMILLTSLFVPDSVLAAAGGAMFGLVVGTIVTVVAVVATQVVAFTISRHFLNDRVEEELARRPKLHAIRQAADREGLRLQLLLRLTPLSPVLVSYIVGITRVGFRSFLIACVALLPGLFVEVYCGYAAKHMLRVSGNPGEHSTLHTTLTLVGLVFCILLLGYVTRIAHQALAEAEAEVEQPSG